MAKGDDTVLSTEMISTRDTNPHAHGNERVSLVVWLTRGCELTRRVHLCAFRLLSVCVFFSVYLCLLLLDSKRSNNVAIMLAQFRISYQDIKIAILELNEDILDAETVEKMVPACPEASEMIQIRDYEGDLKLLGKAELYFREVGQIARLQTRLQTFHYKLVYEDKVKEVADGISKLDAAVIIY